MESSIHPLVQLAREAIKEYIKTGKFISLPAELTDEMREKHGVLSL